MTEARPRKQLIFTPTVPALAIRGRAAGAAFWNLGRTARK